MRLMTWRALSTGPYRATVDTAAGATTPTATGCQPGTSPRRSGLIS